jgi:hypothetical protein
MSLPQAGEYRMITNKQTGEMVRNFVSWATVVREPRVAHGTEHI